jgi:hypothetical protein
VRGDDVSARSTARLAASVVAVVALVAACAPEPVAEPGETQPEPQADAAPSAPSGARVGVVLSPADDWHPAVIDSMRRDVRIVQSMARQGVYEIRTLVPDDEVFVPDLVGLLVNDRHDLTCALTTGASSTVRAHHQQVPQRRFCAVVTTVLTTEEDPGFDVVVLRTAELGYVVGVAAAEAADDGVSVLLGPHDLERGRFRDGLRAALSTTTVIEPDPELAPVDAVVAAVAEGADVVIVGGGPDGAEVAAAAVEAGARVLVPDPLASAVDASALVLSWRVRWDRVLRGPVDRLLGRDEGVPLVLGLSENAFVFRFGPAAPAGTNAAVRQASEEIMTGVRDPLGNGPVPPGRRSSRRSRRSTTGSSRAGSPAATDADPGWT